MVSAKRAREGAEQQPPPTWLAALIVGVLLFAAYVGSLGGGFVLDDEMSVTDNPSIRRLGALDEVLWPPATSTVGGRPIANLTFALNYALSGLESRGYRITNLAIHFAAALCLFGIVRRTLARAAEARPNAFLGRDAWWLALAATVIWVLHPVQSATVAYVSQRTEQLMGLFYLLTLYCFIRGVSGGPSRWLACSVAACALGMGSKEVMATAPLVVLLYDRTFVAGSFVAAWRARRGYYVALGASWVLLAFLVMDLKQRAVGFGLGVTWWRYALTECQAVLLYVKLAVWPHPLVFDYGPRFFTGIGEALPYVAAVGVVAFFVVRALVRQPVVGFLAAGFFIVLGPTSSVVPVAAQPIAESRMYVPLAFAIVLLVTGAIAVMKKRIPAWLGVVALALAFLTAARTHVLADPVRLWRDTLAKVPTNPRAHNNLGGQLFARGDTDAAIAHAREAIRLDPTVARPHTNLAAALLKKGQPAEALQHGLQALALAPGMTDTNYQIGNALAHLGRAAEAISYYQAEIRIRPDYANAYSNLGATLYMLGRPAEAIPLLETAVRLDSRATNARENLASALAQVGRREEAIALYRASLQERPNAADVRTNLGIVLAQAGRYAEAQAEFAAALQVQPDYEPARRGLVDMQALLRKP